MTIKDAIIKALEDFDVLANSIEICDHIQKNNYAEFRGKTPHSTVSAQLGGFIRKGDSRVRRIKQKGGIYAYYLTKKEELMELDDNLSNDEVEQSAIVPSANYMERDLHILLSSYLKTSNVFSKTIFHEKSKYAEDNNQIWSHPDMVGIKFMNLQTKISQNFLRGVNRVDTFKMSSYEIKKEIRSDAELKKAFFQAVSNSSWANFGYLVAFEFNDSLKDEIERLSQSFGIGIIELKPNPFLSKTIFPAKYRNLDFKTIDKLCKINKEFSEFIEQVDKLLNAQERYFKSTERELLEFCDKYLENDAEIEKYCAEKSIPIEEDNEH